jgi:solute carrier family 25 oxoglutarate transporter 11
MSTAKTPTPTPTPVRHSTVTSGQANPVAKAMEPFVCGGSAATFASIVIHPLDLAKVRMQLYGQLNPGKPIPGFPTIISNMVKHDGVLSIYKGVDAAIGRQMVYGTARIGLHRMFSDKLVEWNDGQPIFFFQKTLSGMASGALAVCIGTPFDIALVRLQSDGMADPADRRNYRNVFDALIRTTREEGVGALYKGLMPNILRGMSMVRLALFWFLRWSTILCRWYHLFQLYGFFFLTRECHSTWYCYHMYVLHIERGNVGLLRSSQGICRSLIG